MRVRSLVAGVGAIAIASVGLVSTALPAEAALTATVRSAVSATSSASGTDYVASFRVSNRTHRAKTAVVVSSVPGLGCTVVVKPRSLGTCKATAHLDKKAARAHSVTVKSGVGSELSFYPARATVITKPAKNGTIPSPSHGAYRKGTLTIDRKPGPLELYWDYFYSLTVTNPNDVGLPVEIRATPRAFSDGAPCATATEGLYVLTVPAHGSVSCHGWNPSLHYSPIFVPGSIKFGSVGDPNTFLQVDPVDSGVKYPTDPADVDFEINTNYIAVDGNIVTGVPIEVSLPITPNCFGSPAVLSVTSKRLGSDPGRQSWPPSGNQPTNEVFLTCWPDGPTYTVKFVPTAAEVKAQKISFDLTFTSRGGAKKSFTVDLAP